MPPKSKHEKPRSSHGGKRVGAGRRASNSLDKSTRDALLNKDFKSKQIAASGETLPDAQPYYLVETARKAYEKADRKYAEAMLEVKRVQATISKVAERAENTQGQVAKLQAMLTRMQEDYDKRPEMGEDVFMEMDKVLAEQKEAESLLFAQKRAAYSSRGSGAFDL